MSQAAEGPTSQGNVQARAAQRMQVPTIEVPPEIMRDLEASGLRASDMRIRRLGEPERVATGCSDEARGYVIPYYDMAGDAIPFYRVKVLNSLAEHGIKYRQPRKSPNHIYFPPGLRECLIRWTKEHSGHPIIVITEGEKKAACAVKNGIPCVGLGGVDSWRSRTIILPKDVELSSGKSSIRARLPASDVSVPELALMAEGFGQLVDAIVQYNLTPVIVFDSDKGGTVKSDVQRAATMLGYELRYLGIPSSRIRQVILPEVPDPDTPDEVALKTGIDDFIVHVGTSPLIALLKDAFSDPEKFPRHPNPKGFIGVQMNGMLSRKDCMQISSVILAELDAMGVRFKDTYSGSPYFYDRKSHKLMPARILNSRGNVMHEAAFGTLLYQRFGLTSTDSRILSWVASQFTGEEPIKDVFPRRIRTLITENEDPSNPHGVALQTSDSTFIAVSPDPKKPITLHTNGDLGILFEQGQVEPVDVDRVLELFEEFNRETRVTPWWAKVLEDTNVGKTPSGTTKSADNAEELDEGFITPEGVKMRELACLLFYISPFLERWRGIQLPVEIMIGEAGSGKSSLYNMRLRIVTGRPRLRNVPSDIRDWNAAITNSGGLHVVDNVHFSDRKLKQQLSDEVCRLITEPNPTVEMRKLYTEAENLRLPVDVTFAFTAVQQPFVNADLFSRAAIFKTCALGKPPEGDWVARQLDAYGGREAWLAHHLVFLHRFMAYADKERGGWNPDFKTDHRLAQLEQALYIAGKILDIPVEFLTATVANIQAAALTETDWTLQGLKMYIDYRRVTQETGIFCAKDVCEWALGYEDVSDNAVLQSPRKLGRYIQLHYSAVSRTCAVLPARVIGNVQYYRYEPRRAGRT